VGHDGAGIGGDKQLAVPDAEEHRRPAARRDDLSRLVRGQDRDAVGAHDVLQRRADPILESLAGSIFDQMRQRLGVGICG